jgi:hypothetical protein
VALGVGGAGEDGLGVRGMHSMNDRHFLLVARVCPVLLAEVAIEFSDVTARFFD